jgi:hypothetical protein
MHLNLNFEWVIRRWEPFGGGYGPHRDAFSGDDLDRREGKSHADSAPKNDDNPNRTVRQGEHDAHRNQ